MEKIKFRIWQTCWDDEELQIMHPIKGIDFEKQIYWVTTSSAGYNFKDAILMQWTGLKDKNGKEIYEGDIFDQGIVVFSNGCFNGCYICSTTGEKGWDYSDEWEDGLKYYTSKNEILGNIYENPELINKQ